MFADISTTQPAVWTAIAAGSGAVLGALIAGAITFRVTDRSVKSTERIAEAQRTHQTAMAIEARHRRRDYEDTYVALNELVQRGNY